MHISSKTIAQAALVSACLFSASAAFAEDCEGLGGNKEWLDGMVSIQASFKAENYDEALDTAKKLYGICSISPTLLYYMGAALEKKGDAEHALIYYQKSSEAISKMAVDPGVSRKIWYKRYELENPDRTAEAVAQQKDAFEQQKAEIESLKLRNVELETARAVSTVEVDNYRTIMWAGTGAGIGGIAMIAAGAALLGTMNGDFLDFNSGSMKVKPGYKAGWAVFGLGIGLAAAGGITAGIAGYHYAKAKKDAVLSFQISPSCASLSMTF